MKELPSPTPYDQAALDEASRELHMFFLREGSRYGTKACEEIGRVFMTAYQKAASSEKSAPVAWQAKHPGEGSDWFETTKAVFESKAHVAYEYRELYAAPLPHERRSHGAMFTRKAGRKHFPTSHLTACCFQKATRSRTSMNSSPDKKEPYGYCWYNKHGEYRFTHSLPHPKSSEQPIGEAVPVYRAPVSATRRNMEWVCATCRFPVPDDGTRYCDTGEACPHRVGATDGGGHG